MKFKTGDKFITNIENDSPKIGMILDVIYNPMNKDYEYLVKWDHFKEECVYSSKICDLMWELIPSEKNEFKCEHNWKNYVGFTESFTYCIKCDEKRN